jgi:hypothetical protein
MAIRIRDFSRPVKPTTPGYPPLNSPEFDVIAKDWLEELIRRARSKHPSGPRLTFSPNATSRSKNPALTIPARGEGQYAFNFYLTNMYDLGTDPLGLLAELKEVSRDALEAAVRDAGFNGLIVPAGPGMRGPISLVFDFEESVRIPVQKIRYEVVH